MSLQSICVIVLLFLYQVLWQWLCLVLHVLVQLVWLLIECRLVGVAWTTCALLLLEVLMEQVGEET